MNPSRSIAALLLAALAACQSTQSDDPIEALGIKNTRVLSKQLITCGQPQPGQMAQLSELGIQKFICLRPTSEDGTGWEEAEAREAGLDLVRIEVPRQGGLTHANALAFAEARADDGHYLIFCGSGDRAGAMLALEAFWFDGMPADQALAYAQRAGITKQEPALREILGL